MAAILARKLGMTQRFSQEDGSVQRVTVLEAGPCHVTAIRTAERDGYDAVQLGYKDKDRRKATRAERGHVSANLESKRRSKPAFFMSAGAPPWALYTCASAEAPRWLRPSPRSMSSRVVGPPSRRSCGVRVRRTSPTGANADTTTESGARNSA